MKSITSLILTLVFATNMLAFTHNNDTNIHQNIEGNILISDTVKKTYQLEKFTQSCCTGIVEYSLKKNVKGFIKAVSNTNKGQITVWYDSTKSTNKEVKEAINKTPYKVIKEIK